MKYDDHSWHGDLTDEYPPDEANACIHIAGYLAWACRKGLVDTYYSAAIADAVAQRGTPTEFVVKHFDAKFDTLVLTADGNVFTDRYYSPYLNRAKKLPYVAAYPTIFHVPDTWETCAVYGAVLDELYAEFAED